MTAVVEAASRPARRAEILRGVPGLLLLAAVVLVPFAALVRRSLLDDGPGGAGGFAGLDQYAAVLGSAPWWTTMATTAAVALGLLLVQLVLALVFAVALWHLTLVWWPLRFLALVPAGVGLVVGAHAGRTAVEGGFLASWFGLDPGGAGTALLGVLLGELWRTTGLVVVLVHAGLSRIPTALLDSAVADGATAWQRWRRVLWPALTPTLAFVALYRLLDGWRLLDGPLLVRTDGEFRTTGSALVLDSALGSVGQGSAAAAGVVLVLLAAVLAGLTWVVSRAVKAR